MLRQHSCRFMNDARPSFAPLIRPIRHAFKIRLLKACFSFIAVPFPIPSSLLHAINDVGAHAVPGFDVFPPISLGIFFTPVSSAATHAFLSFPRKRTSSLSPQDKGRNESCKENPRLLFPLLDIFAYKDFQI